MPPIETDRDLLARYANTTGGWVGLQCAGVDVDEDGSLRLQKIPDSGTGAGRQVDAVTGEAPAGCALDACGSGYVSQPDSGQVLIVTRCAGTDIVKTRADDTELLPGAFATPRGLAMGPRGRLCVADGDSVVVVDVSYGAITGRWAYFDEAWCVAVLGDAIYVLDHSPAGAGRVRRFDADGFEDVAFGAAVAASVPEPVRLAAGGGCVYVVSRGAGSDLIVVVREDGTGMTTWAPIRDERDLGTGVVVDTHVTRVAGVAADERRVYLVDAARGDLLSFTPDGAYIGSTRPAWPIVDVWSAGGVLWSYPAQQGQLLRHASGGSYLRSGSFVCGPINTATEHGRRELRADLTSVTGGHVQFWTAVTPHDVAPTPHSIPLPGVTSATSWLALPVDLDVSLVPDPAGPHLFIGCHLGGDGSATPAVAQISVGGARSPLDLLPAVYRKEQDQAEFLDRYLRLIHSVQAETAHERADLVRRFDAWVADDESAKASQPSELEELASWVDVELDERWAERTRRGVVASAFADQAVRGTPKGLLAAIRRRLADVLIQIREPALRAAIWSLEQASPDADCTCHGGGLAGLGFDTMLVAGPPDGAVVGASAVVGQSDLTGGAHLGAPLYSDLAHRFHVFARPAAGSDPAEIEASLQSVVEAQRPAHTVYTLCVVRPDARVGVQCRVGVDAIVAGPPTPIDLDSKPGLGRAVLQTSAPAPPAPPPSFVGELRVGRGRLT